MTLNGHFLVILNPLDTTPEIAEERNVNDFSYNQNFFIPNIIMGNSYLKSNL